MNMEVTKQRLQMITVTIKNLTLVGEKNNEKCYSGLLDLSFINYTKRKDSHPNYFNNNVRGTSFDMQATKSKVLQNKTIKGIYETLDKISEGEDPIIMFEMNQGGSLMCAHIEKIENKNDEYQIIFSNEFHGIGNGQQTISTAYYWKEKNENKNIKPGTLVQFKFFVGYSKEKNNLICVANNTNKPVKNSDLISNDWKEIAEELKEKGIFLIDKKTKTVDTPDGTTQTINLHKDSFLTNLIPSYLGSPWRVGEPNVENDVTERICADDIVEIEKLRDEFDSWFENKKAHLKYKYADYFNAHHLSVKSSLRNLFVGLYNNGLPESKYTSFKKYQNISDKKDISGFFDFCLKAFNQAKNNTIANMTSPKSESFFKTICKSFSDIINVEYDKTIKI